MGYKALAWAAVQKTPTTHAYAVLVALASYADDAGYCWPTQGRIAEQTAQSDRSVRKQIEILIETGFIQKTGNRQYQLFLNRNHVPDSENAKPEPRSYKAEPRSEKPEPRSYKSVIISQNKSIKRKNTKKKNCPRPEDIPQQVWNDFEQLRKSKKAPITETALSRIRNEAEKAGLSMEAALSECCARGWQGFKAEWLKNGEKHDQRNGRNRRYTTEDARREALEELGYAVESGANHGDARTAFCDSGHLRQIGAATENTDESYGRGLVSLRKH